MADNYIGFLIDPKMKEKIKELADKERRKPSEWLRILLEDYLKGK